MGLVDRRNAYALVAHFKAVAKETALVALKQKGGTNKLAATPGKTLRPPVNARLNEETFTPVEATAVRFTILAATASEPCLDELEIYLWQHTLL